MSQKPTTLDQIWPEKDLCERLNLPIGKKGRSADLSHMISEGLKFIEKRGKRFFFEQDVIDFFYSMRNEV